MLLTTTQIYALAILAVLTAILIGISYVAGLRTGRAAGYEDGYSSASTYLRKLLKAKNAANNELQEQIGRGARQLSAAQLRIEEMAAYPTPLTGQDAQTLLDAQELLNLTTPILDSIGCDIYARKGRKCQANLQNISSRINQKLDADRRHPDLILMDWLEENATVDFDPENATLRFLSSPGTEMGIESVRELLRQAKADSDAIEYNHGAGLQAAVAQETAA